MKVPGLFRNATRIEEYRAGSVVFEEGSEGSEMFGVIEGEVELQRDGLDLTLGPDETFGEMALIDSTRRSARAVAVKDTKLAVIDKKTFLFLVHETPMFALQVMSSMADRLRPH